MNAIVAKRRKLRAILWQMSLVADRTFKLGQQAPVYSEQKKEWFGPFIVVESTGRVINVCMRKANVRKHSVLFKLNHLPVLQRKFINYVFKVPK